MPIIPVIVTNPVPPRDGFPAPPIPSDFYRLVKQPGLGALRLPDFRQTDAWLADLVRYRANPR
jgi:hypothetical protein